MPGANNILPFAQGGGANVESQIAYAADTQRPLGNQPGTARSSFVNKTLRQALAMAAAFAQFTADNQGSDVDDTLTPAGMATLFEAALDAYAASHQGSNQDLSSLSAGYISLPGGLKFQWVTGNCDASGILNVVLPIAFTTRILGGIANEADPAGWASNTTTSWAYDAPGSDLSHAQARCRQVAVGTISTSAGIGGRIWVWGL